VASIVAALIAGYDVRFSGKHINPFALSLIAPLGSDYNRDMIHGKWSFLIDKKT
jgi:hypothetical protein